MKGSKVLISGEPKGRFIEGTISGTPLPGTIMQIKAATALSNGNFTFEAFNRDADGNNPQGPLFVLLEKGEGYTYATAYANGDHGYLYCPLPGDEMNLLWSKAGTGAADAVAIGALAIVNDGDGLLIDTTGSPEQEPFMACEAVADVTATGTMVHCMKC